MSDESEVMGELILEQIAKQRCGCVRVNDGQVFVFTRELLEELLAKALESAEDMVMVHVKRGPEA